MGRLDFVVVGSGVQQLQAAPLRGVVAAGVIRDAVVQYTVVQTYVNPLRDDYIEGVYKFPLYEGAAVAGFEAEVDGRKVVGKVREKVEAGEEYQEAVRDGKTALLLEQETPDVFQAHLGNIPPGKTISIRITLVSEIKQDAGESQVRFVLPTAVAPRSGSSSFSFSGAGFTSWNPNPPVSVSAPKLSVNMACAMSKPITSVQSPSHTIEVHVGTNEIVTSADRSYAFDPNRARVTLTEDSLLDRDLVIIIQSLGLDQPRVLVERHPTEQTHAVSLTFQPRFRVQPLRASELVFLVDSSSRSLFGSHTGRIGEALELFLRSIPFQNHYFNVIVPCQHALFPTSVEFDAESLREGIQHAQAMQASGGGTDIASAIPEVCQRRRRDVPLQIFVLTDGKISKFDQLRRVISNAVDDGERSNHPFRVFCLGVGDSISHHQIESVARAGGGCAHVVMARERMEKKVANLLQAALTPPITHTVIQWTDSIVDTFVTVAGDEEGADHDLAHLNQNPGKSPINLFSELASPPGISQTNPPLPEISPAINQAPFKPPVVCPGVRFTVYAILSPTTPLPTELVLRGISPDGPVELRVKIESVVESGTMLHSLAARALVRDLEEASSPFHALRKMLTPHEADKLQHLGMSVAQREDQTGRNRSDFLPLTFNHVAEITKQQTVDIGVRYGLSTKYTSWVAVDEEGPRNVKEVRPYIVKVFGHATPASLFGAPLSASSSGGVLAQTASGLFGSCTPALGPQSQGPSFGSATFGSSPALAYGGTPAPAFGATPAPAFGGTQASPFGAMQAPAFGATEAPAFGATQAPAFGATQAPLFGAPRPAAFGVASLRGGCGFGQAQGSALGASKAETRQVASPFSSSDSLFGSTSVPRAPSFGGGFWEYSSSPDFHEIKPQRLEVVTDDLQQREVLRVEDDQAATSSTDAHTRTTLQSLVQYQSFDGLFPLVPAIGALFNTSVDILRTKLQELRMQCTGLVVLAEEQWEAIWATILAVEFIKSKSRELQDEWQLVAEKAERQVESLLKNSEHLARFKVAAKAS